MPIRASFEARGYIYDSICVFRTETASGIKRDDCGSELLSAAHTCFCGHLIKTLRQCILHIKDSLEEHTDTFQPKAHTREVFRRQKQEIYDSLSCHACTTADMYLSFTFQYCQCNTNNKNVTDTESTVKSCQSLEYSTLLK